MPIYEYECKEGHHSERLYRIAERKDKIKCPVCKEWALLSISKRQYARTFKPYVESNFDGTPIEITSKEQRDTLLKKHGTTYDSYKHTTVTRPKHPIDDLDFAEVKRVAERGKLDDGTPLDRPYTPKEGAD